MRISTIPSQLLETLSVQRVHECEVHGTYDGGIYCEECEEDDSRPHDVWGDKMTRFTLNK